MKTITYRAVFQNGTGRVVEETFEVRAANINAGFRKATAQALRSSEGGRWEIHSLAFHAVTS